MPGYENPGMTKQQMQLSRVMPAVSLASILGVERRWLEQEAAAGRLPGVQAGRTWLFHQETVERLLSLRASGAYEAQTRQEVSHGR